MPVSYTHLVGDDLLFALQLPVGIDRAERHVGDQFGSLRKIAAERRGVDRRILLGGEGVQLAAEVFEAAVHLPGAPPLRPLEEGVLGEVRQSVFARPFVAASGVHDQRAMRHRALHLPVDAPDAVRKSVCVKSVSYTHLAGTFELPEAHLRRRAGAGGLSLIHISFTCFIRNVRIFPCPVRIRRARIPSRLSVSSGPCRGCPDGYSSNFGLSISA